MKISEQFAGSYLKASDLPQPKVFTIAGCEHATMPDGTTKPALRFAGETQQLVLNKTNSFCLMEWFGDDTNGWLNRQVELYSTTTSFSGRMVPAIRLRQAPQWQQQPLAPQVPQPPVQQAPQPQYIQHPAPQPQVPVQQYAAPQQFVQQQQVPQQMQQVPTQAAPEPQRPSPENWPYFKQETSNVPQPLVQQAPPAPPADYPIDA